MACSRAIRFAVTKEDEYSMRLLEQDSFGPADFDDCFDGEPPQGSVAADLRRGHGRLRRRRSFAVAMAAAAAFITIAAVAALPLDRSMDATPANQTAVPPTSVAPARRTPPTARPTPASPTTIGDTAPRLRRDARGNYLDRDGRSGGSLRYTAFSATTKNTYDLVSEHLDPTRAHLGRYEAIGFTGGGAGDSLQIGQKLSWKVKGQPGEGMLLVSVSRPFPNKKVKINGPSGMGQCPGYFLDVKGPCRQRTIGGHKVWYADLPNGGFVMDYEQPDGEIASIVKDPLFGNNTTVALRSMKVSPSQAIELLSDRRLDVLG